MEEKAPVIVVQQRLVELFLEGRGTEGTIDISHRQNLASPGQLGRNAPENVVEVDRLGVPSARIVRQQLPPKLLLDRFRRRAEGSFRCKRRRVQIAKEAVDRPHG